MRGVRARGTIRQGVPCTDMGIGSFAAGCGCELPPVGSGTLRRGGGLPRPSRVAVRTGSGEANLSPTGWEHRDTRLWFTGR